MCIVFSKVDFYGSYLLFTKAPEAGMNIVISQMKKKGPENSQIIKRQSESGSQAFCLLGQCSSRTVLEMIVIAPHTLPLGSSEHKDLSIATLTYSLPSRNN